MAEGEVMDPALELEDEEGEERIAIVGMAGRFPGAAGVGELWRNLLEGVDSVSHFSDQEVAAAGVEPALYRHPSYVKARGVLAGAELFDAPFFGFSAREAQITDPQHRVFLECAWQALEEAGHAAGAAGARVGVYAGTITSTYLIHNLLSNADSFDGLESWQVAVGNEKDALTTRVSYKLDLRGPSVSVQTACSSSLVAVHLGCQALMDYQCDLVLAGGVSIRFPQHSGYLYHPQGIVSPDGHCRPFDAAAQGTVFGSGAGVVVLKRLADALAGGDAIRAVIRGSAVNNDGANKIGFTAPGVEGQAAVITQALALAEVDPATLGLVEAHGTGTELGDLIEVEALTRVFRAATRERGFCALGSVKSNVGHLDNAAGVCGLIKAVLALEHGLIPPTAHFQRPNPRLGLEESPFFVNDRPMPWPAAARPRRAGVSSFGIGGTNAHLVLEEAPAPAPSSPSRPGQLLLLSARTPGALEEAAERLAAHLESHPGEELADVAWTLAAGRRRFPYRRAMVCRGREEAPAALRQRPPAPAAEERQERPVAFLLPGQGAQHPGMLAGLYETAPAFRASLNRSAELLQPHLEADLRRLLFDTGEGAGERLAATDVAQPALFALELALAEQWRELGVEPEAMLGHSLGEYVAATLAGVFSAQDGLALVAARGRLMAGLPAGAMLAVPLPEAQVRELLARRGGDGLALAAVNGPERSVVSGPEAEVEALAGHLRAEGVQARRLHTSHAFHSSMMEPMLPAFGEEVARLTLSPPRRPFLSNVTGTWITQEEATDPAYWVRHCRAPVRFADGLAGLLAEPARVLLEVGPGQSLSSLARRHPAREPGQAVVASARRAQEAVGGEESDRERLLTAAGELWRAGADLAAAGLFPGEVRRRRPLPTYPFERRPYWLPPRRGAGVGATASPARRDDPATWFHLPSWKRTAAPRPATASLAGTRWLLLADGLGVATALARALEEAGARVASALPGEAFHDPGPEGPFRLRPGRGEDFEALLAALEARGEPPDHLLHLWSLAPVPAAEGAPAAGALAAFDRQEQEGFASLLPAVQAMARRRRRGLTVIVAASQVARVLGGDEVAPGKAALTGLCRVLPGELPEARCRLVDFSAVGSDGGESDPEALAHRLLGELGASGPPGGGEPAVVAYRGGERWAESLEPVRLEAPEGEGEALGLRPGGAYLITGGLDGAGFALARGLAQNLARRLAPRLALVVPPGTAENRQERLEELAAAGAREVAVLEADLADGEAVARTLTEAVGRLGALDGVIHAVGPPAAGPGDEAAERAAERFAPLVRGALHLDRLLAAGEGGLGRPPAFLLLLSPLAAAVGGAGELPAAAAGAVLGALADRARATGRRPFTVTVDWHLGMEGENGSTAAGSLDPEQGWTALERILAGLDEGRVVVCPADPEALRRALSRPPEEEAAPPPVHPRPHLETDYAQPSTPLEERLAAAWGQALGLAQVGVHDNFFDLGGDSLLALQLASRLRQIFPVEIGPRDLFEQPTVAALAEVVDGRLLARIESMPDEEAERLMASLAGES